MEKETKAEGVEMKPEEWDAYCDLMQEYSTWDYTHR